MPPTRLVIVSDAHLGGASSAVEEAFLRFLAAVPSLGDELLINGDLFEFWFEYRRVVPREGFRVVAALAALRKRIPITIIGGNHDRWGGDFWRKDLGIEFVPDSAPLRIGSRRGVAVHGDGIVETHWSARWLHRVTRHPATSALFRLLHPDLGLALVDRLSHALGRADRSGESIARAAAAQVAWARAQTQADPGLGLIVMGHTHQAQIVELGEGRQYLNPGAWFDGFRYAIATETDASLARFA